MASVWAKSLFRNAGSDNAWPLGISTNTYFQNEFKVVVSFILKQFETTGNIQKQQYEVKQDRCQR